MLDVWGWDEEEVSLASYEFQSGRAGSDAWSPEERMTGLSLTRGMRT